MFFFIDGLLVSHPTAWLKNIFGESSLSIRPPLFLYSRLRALLGLLSNENYFMSGKIEQMTMEYAESSVFLDRDPFLIDILDKNSQRFAQDKDRFWNIPLSNFLQVSRELLKERRELLETLKSWTRKRVSRLKDVYRRQFEEEKEKIEKRFAALPPIPRLDEKHSLFLRLFRENRVTTRANRYVFTLIDQLRRLESLQRVSDQPELAMREKVLDQLEVQLNETKKTILARVALLPRNGRMEWNSFALYAFRELKNTEEYRQQIKESEQVQEENVVQQKHRSFFLLKWIKFNNETKAELEKLEALYGMKRPVVRTETPPPSPPLFRIPREASRIIIIGTGEQDIGSEQVTLSPIKKTPPRTTRLEQELEKISLEEEEEEEDSPQGLPTFSMQSILGEEEEEEKERGKIKPWRF